MRDARASGERTNTSTAALMGIVRSVRGVRDFKVLKNKNEKMGWHRCGLRKKSALPPLSFKSPTSRTPRTKPMEIGKTACAVRRGTAKQRTWSSRRLIVSTHSHQTLKLEIQRGIRIVYLTNISLRLQRRTGTDRPLGHFRVKPVLWSVAFLEQLP